MRVCVQSFTLFVLLIPGIACYNQSCGRGCTGCAEDSNCSRCRDGYFLHIKNGTYVCSKCPANCKTCESDSFTHANMQCVTCKDRSVLHIKDNNTRIQVCSKCPAKCEKCEPHPYKPKYLQCKVCIHGYYFSLQDLKYICVICSRECQTCSSDDNCITCKDGYHFNNSTCICTDGFWGHECKYSCTLCTECDSEVCLIECETKSWSDVCPDAPRSCKNECSKGFIGQRKSDVSNSTPHTTTLTTRAVSRSNTFSKTDPTISHHQRTECILTQLTTTQTQRKITDTTIIRTEPQETTMPLTATTTSENVTKLETQAQTNGSKSTVLNIVIAVIAGLALMGVIVVIICVKRRKRTRCPHQESPPQNSNNEEYIYAKPNKVKKTDSQKGQSNKLDLLNKDPSSALASEQGHEESNRGCTDVTCHVTDTVLDKDGIILETCLDESETAVTEESSTTGQSIDDDTYYNVLSIKRNLVKVDKFEEYVKSKSTFDFYTEFEKFPKGLSRPHTHAKKPENKVKCRYNGVYPYDTNRVKLLDTANDFINASYIDGYTRQKEYIASLGPTKETMADFVDFWAMIWQDNVEKIVMLTKLVEETKMKCEQYWPDIGDTIRYGDVIVTCQSDDVYTDYRFRTFSVKQGETTRLVHQTHFLSWPDKRVPDRTDVLLTLRDKVRAVKSEMDGPIVVHCSAGVGRTGTYIALDILLQQLTEEGAVDVYGCVIGIRGQRVAMVQTLEQYEYIHNVLLESIQTTKSKY